jgi:hypothetical protein
VLCQDMALISGAQPRCNGCNSEADGSLNCPENCVFFCVSQFEHPRRILAMTNRLASCVCYVDRSILFLAGSRQHCSLFQIRDDGYDHLLITEQQEYYEKTGTMI